MQQKMAKVIIPEDLAFSNLRLDRDPDGSVSFDWTVINRICEASDLPVEMFQDVEADVCGLIIGWYLAHRKAGGEADLIAEELFTEVQEEEKRGQTYSHNPGRA